MHPKNSSDALDLSATADVAVVTAAAAGAVCSGAASAGDPAGRQGQGQDLCVRGQRVAAQAHLQRLHHHGAKIWGLGLIIDDFGFMPMGLNVPAVKLVLRL